MIKRNYLIYSLLIFFLILTGCAYQREKGSGFPEDHGKRHNFSNYRQKGVASWYGPQFHGRPTASGEAYNMYAYTAAHRILPFQSKVRITNLKNKKKVVVRINDRGPFVKNRIIDLSYAAAKQLKMIGPGTAPVLLQTLSTQQENPLPSRYYIQTGSFLKLSNAQKMLTNLKRQGYKNSRLNKVTIEGLTYWRCQAGIFFSLDSAKQALARLQRKVPASFIVAD